MITLISCNIIWLFSLAVAGLIILLKSFPASQGHDVFRFQCIQERPIDLLQLDKEIKKYRNSPRYIQYFGSSKHPYPTPAPQIVPKQKCGVRGMVADHILRGKPAPDGSEPWMARLHLYLFGRYALCGGTLIASTWVLTAAHCKLGVLSEIKVALNLYDLDDTADGRKSIKVEPQNFFPHPYYNDHARNYDNENDLALIKLPYPVTDFPNVYPICLPKIGKQSIISKSPAYAIGWGYTKVDPITHIRIGLPKHLLKVPMNYRKCMPFYSVLCGHSPTFGGGICQGDSGGPLIVAQPNEFTIVGISSMTNARCVNNLDPGLFTNVFAHLPWIKETMLKHGD